jgi:DNA-binding MarR family transcriptional regulator
LAQEYRRGLNTLRQLLKEAGVHRSSQSEVGRARWGLEVREITPAGWQALYWGLENGCPSMRALGERFGVTPTTIKRYLLAAGIKIRSRSEQAQIGCRSGRRRETILTPEENAARAEKLRARLAKARTAVQRRPLSVEQRRRLSESQRRRVSVSCWWCGDLVEGLLPHRAKAFDYHYCCRPHVALGSWFRRKHDPDTPRPLIVNRLVYLARTRGKPYTYLRVERLMGECGAKIVEVEAALDRLQEL